MLSSLSSLLLAATFQVGPFYEQKTDDWALRPFASREAETTDVLWPVFTAHRDWWRFCYLVNYQSHAEAEGYQFSIVPFWFNGRTAESGSYWGFFPLYGHHPHIAMLYDVDWALWPLWMRYRMPRDHAWLETNSVLFPFVSWRSDGAWSLWPVYGVNYQRESDHRYFLWPIVTWAEYREDRDTAGSGTSWMVWPLFGTVDRAREKQTSVLPPFFSFATTWGSGRMKVRGGLHSGPESVRIRCPWPFFEYEDTPVRARFSLWPFYEKDVAYGYRTGERTSTVTRIGWKLIELYDDETRVFPFYASGRDHFRLWPFWESETDKKGEVTHGRLFALFPIRWVPAVDRNWAKYWTFYENATCPLYTDHSLLWGIIRWRTLK